MDNDWGSWNNMSAYSENNYFVLEGGEIVYLMTRADSDTENWGFSNESLFYEPVVLCSFRLLYDKNNDLLIFQYFKCKLFICKPRHWEKCYIFLESHKVYQRAFWFGNKDIHVSWFINLYYFYDASIRNMYNCVIVFLCSFQISS